MPNWCETTLVLDGPDAEAALAHVVNPATGGLDYGQAVPEPIALSFLPELGRQPTGMAGVLTARYGAPDWYLWRLSYWGVKWPAGGAGETITPTREQTEIRFTFDTPWGPPTAWLKAVAHACQDLNVIVHLAWDEPGCDFAGWCTWHRGIEIEQIDLPGSLSNLANTHLGTDLPDRWAHLLHPRRHRGPLPA